MATYVTKEPVPANNVITCGNGSVAELKVETQPDEGLMSIVAKAGLGTMGAKIDASIGDYVRDFLATNPEMLSRALSMNRPRLVFTLIGPPRRPDSTHGSPKWRIPFKAFLIDD
jgi:hypothetical protein